MEDYIKKIDRFNNSIKLSTWIKAIIVLGIFILLGWIMY